MAKVLYLSQWFPPENGAVGLQVTRALKDRGYEVEALTGFPNYPSGKLAPNYKLSYYLREEMDGIVVHRVLLYPSHDLSSVKRAINYISFFVSSLIFLLFRGRNYDVIYVYHPPILPAFAAALSGLITRRPFIVEVQDLWPDSVATAGMRGATAIAGVLGPVCGFVYRRAAVVLGQSEGMAKRLIERGAAAGKTGVVSNWADESAVRSAGQMPARRLNFEGRFNFVYAGNLGTVQALEILVEAAGLAADVNPQIQLTLIGDGAERGRLEQFIKEAGGRVAQIVDAVPIAEVGAVLSKADVLVVHLKDDPLFEITIPSKVQFYLAMGKPVLAAVAGEASRIVDGAGAGMTVRPGNAQAVAEAMLQMAALSRDDLEAMGALGRAAYEARFSFDAGLDRRAAFIQAAIAGQPVQK